MPGRSGSRCLETYRLPAQLVKHPTPRWRTNPLACGRVWDRAELQAHYDLGELIKDSLMLALPDCHLLAERRAIPLGGEGDPNLSADARPRAHALHHRRRRTQRQGRYELLPSTLRAQEPKAPDARKQGDGKANAKLMLPLTMLGVGFDVH